MSLRKTPFQVDEWFHCYNRGIDKRKVFENESDAERFLQLLFLTNSEEPIHRSNLMVVDTADVLDRPRASTLVSVGAYCLMPNHYHLLLKETNDGGITRFMQKLGTSYTMYFNTKYERGGNLFLKPFRAKHVGEDRYFQRVVDYIHCNPIELFERGWKRGVVSNVNTLVSRLMRYRYSSFPDYSGKQRPERSILSDDGFAVYRIPSPYKMLEDSRAYYASISEDDAFFFG